MLTARVTGNVWSTRRLAEIPNGAFLEVEVEGTGQRFVAFDVLGSGLGERVLIAQGSVAAAWFPGKPPPVDALIIGSIDEPAGGTPAGESRAREKPAGGAPARGTSARGKAAAGTTPGHAAGGRHAGKRKA